MSAERDGELVRSFLRGEEEAFEQLVTLHETKVRKLAYGFVRDWHKAEDVAQDAFLLAYQRLDSLQVPEAFRGWLYRIVINRAHDELRRVARAPMDSMDSSSLGESERGGLDSRLQPSDDARGAEESEARAMRQNLEAALAALPREQSEALVLKAVHGMKYVEIGEQLGCPIGTAQIRVFRARKRLRELLSPDDPTVGGGASEPGQGTGRS